MAPEKDQGESRPRRRVSPIEKLQAALLVLVLVAGPIGFAVVCGAGIGLIALGAASLVLLVLLMVAP